MDIFPYQAKCAHLPLSAETPECSLWWGLSPFPGSGPGGPGASHAASTAWQASSGTDVKPEAPGELGQPELSEPTHTTTSIKEINK